MESGFRARNSSVLGSLFLITAILFFIQNLTLERLKLVLIGDADATQFNPGMGGKLTALLSTLQPVDWILALSLATVIIVLIYREIRGGRVSRELAQILQAEHTTLILLGILSVAASRYYISPGLLTLGDCPPHMSRIWAVTESIREGHYPFWSFYNYAGFPLLQFYGPLFHLIAGATAIVVGNIDWATKAWLFLFQVGSAFALYFWVRSLERSRAAALVSALAYVLTFQRVHTVVWTGALPAAGMFFFFPLLFLAIEKLLRSASGRWVPVVSLSTAALILVHQGYGIYIVQLALYYVLLRSLLSGTERPGLKASAAALLGVVGGVLLCTVFLWPLLLEKGFVYYPNELPLLIPQLPTLTLLTATLGWRMLWSPGAASYIGISLAAFAVYGGITVWRKRNGGKTDAAGRAVAILALFTLLCAASGGRILNLSLPFLAILCGYITGLKLNATPQKVLLAALVILIVDLGPTTIQSPFRSDRRFIRDGMRNAAARIEPHRALFGYRSSNGTHYFHWGYNEQSGLIIPTGFFPQGAPHSLNSITAMVDGLNASDGALTPNQLDLLYLWDVTAVMTYDRERFLDPGLEGVSSDGTDPPLARTARASPLIFSNCLAIAEDDTVESLDREQHVVGYGAKDHERRTYLRRMTHWVGRMGIHRESNLASMFFLANGEKDFLESADTYGCPDSIVTGNPLVVTDYSVELSRVSIRYRTDDEGFLRLAFSWYPTLKVLLDGVEVEQARSLFGAIVVRTPPGDLQLEVVPVRTNRNLPILIGTVAGLVLTLLGWVLAVTRRLRL